MIIKKLGENLFKSIFYLLLFLFVMFFLVILVVICLDPILPQSDYCLEDGDCKEGRQIMRDGKMIIINEQSCIEHNWKWNKHRKECKVK